MLSTLRKSGINFQVSHCKYCSDIRFCCRQIFLQHKAVVLILVWTMIVGELLAFEQLLIGGLIDSYMYHLVIMGINTLLIQYHLH